MWATSTDYIEEGDTVVVTSGTGYVNVRVGMFGLVIETRRDQGERWLKVIFDGEIDVPVWVNAGCCELALNPIEELGEQYFL